jgi:hypothetical protein
MESAPGSSEDLATKCRRALKSVVAKLTALPALDALVHQALPEAIMRMVLEQVRPLLLTAVYNNVRAATAAAAGAAVFSYTAVEQPFAWCVDAIRLGPSCTAAGNQLMPLLLALLWHCSSCPVLLSVPVPAAGRQGAGQRPHWALPVCALWRPGCCAADG